MPHTNGVETKDIALSFKQVGVSTLFPPKTIVCNISGYVKKGGMTAILGASASGKSVLMKAIAGRLPKLHLSGEVILNGKPIDPKDISNNIGYVPQDDFLQGEFTAREILTNASLMKRNHGVDAAKEDVDRLIRDFGIAHVADNIIGTVFVRGLSGGQRKRVEVCSELVAPSNVLLLDEPTSGLDGAIAYDVLNAIKTILKEKKDKLSVILSIHQPNTRILELFDNILLLSGNGGMTFFGTLEEAQRHFNKLGFPVPEQYTPTDVYLQVTDTNFGSNMHIDFEGSFSCSEYCSRLGIFLEEVKRDGLYQALKDTEDDDDTESAGSKSGDWKVVKVSPAQNATSTEEDDNVSSANDTINSLFFRQISILLWREFALAFRDPSLYYLQFVLVSAFGFLVGAAFFDQQINIDSKMNYINGGLVWIVMMMCYIQVFKIYHLNRANHRFKHDVSNKTFSVFAYWLAELLSTAILLLTFIPSTAIAYFMMKFPNDSYPFIMLTYWTTALTSETMLGFISKFSEDATVSIVTGQGVLVILTVFAGGLFIAWDDCPDYWVWLQEISIFTQSSRAAIMGVFDDLDFKCYVGSSGVCSDTQGNIYSCDVSGVDSNGYCEVSGREVLHVTQGTIKDESKWVPYGYLILIFVIFRLLSLFLMYYPVEMLIYYLQDFYAGVTARGLIDNQLAVRRVEKLLRSFMTTQHSRDLQEHGIHIPSNKSDQHHSNKASDHGDDETGALLQRQSTFSRVHKSEAHRLQFLFNPDAHHSQQDSEHALAPMFTQGSCLQWKDLSVVLKKNGKVLINKVSGTAFPGRILALMGPSGAGKTTLLNALSNRTPYAKLLGEVTFSGRAFTPADLVYVPQFDEFNASLTVYEQIELVGALKCVDVKAMRSRLVKLLDILGLADKMHQSCKKLTGGELKRVSVGMGMISSPHVLFLDEPTTGLDSSAAYSLVKFLSELSIATNVVIIMTIHQPAQIVFDMLQDLYLLEAGNLAYFGPLKATKQYFHQLGYDCVEGINPADFYLDLVNNKPDKPGQDGNNWNDLYYQSIFSKNFNYLVEISTAKGESNVPTENPPSETARFFTLCNFFWKYYSRDVGFYYLRFVFLIIVALFLGTLFVQLRPNTRSIPLYSGAIFFNIWTILFSTVAATGLLATDRRIAIEQVKNAVISPGSYCFAQFCISLPFNTLAGLLFQCIFHWLININPDGESFVYAILITAVHMQMMEAIMLTVVGVLKNAMLSVTFAMVVLGYLFLFSGFFVLIADMPPWIGWLSYITPTMYSFHGYLWQVFDTQDFDITGESTGAELSGNYVLDKFFDMRDINSWGMFGAMLAWIALFRLSHYFVFYLDVRPYLLTNSASK